MRFTLLPLGLVWAGALLFAPATFASSAPCSVAQDDAEIQRLQKKIAELEALVRDLEAPKPVDLEGETSVKPGINKRWKSEDIQGLVKILEAESREIWTERETLAAVVGVREGMVVADIGAGSGFMSFEFAKRVGDDGKVIAVDINAKMMKMVGDAARGSGISQLETHVCGEKSVDLPKGSVDLVFICDTYHHFEYPRNTMKSIRDCLKPGGQIVLVDFHRIEGVSREWILNHVRAGQEVFTQEILDSGFRLLNDHSSPKLLKENYILRFQKSLTPHKQ